MADNQTMTYTTSPTEYLAANKIRVRADLANSIFGATPAEIAARIHPSAAMNEGVTFTVADLQAAIEALPQSWTVQLRRLPDFTNLQHEIAEGAQLYSPWDRTPAGQWADGYSWGEWASADDVDVAAAAAELVSGQRKSCPGPAEWDSTTGIISLSGGRRVALVATEVGSRTVRLPAVAR